MILFPKFCSFVFLYSQFWSGSYLIFNWLSIDKEGKAETFLKGFIHKIKSGSHVCISKNSEGVLI